MDIHIIHEDIQGDNYGWKKHLVDLVRMVPAASGQVDKTFQIQVTLYTFSL